MYEVSNGVKITYHDSYRESLSEASQRFKANPYKIVRIRTHNGTVRAMYRPKYSKRTNKALARPQVVKNW